METNNLTTGTNRAAEDLRLIAVISESVARAAAAVGTSGVTAFFAGYIEKHTEALAA